MGFVPRLPTWHNEAEVSRIEREVPGHTDTGIVIGQVYCCLRNAVVGDVHLYFMFPKEDAELIQPAVGSPSGLFVYKDVLKFEWPVGSGMTHVYFVEIVHPRWLGFPNEHCIALLDWMDPYERQYYGYDPNPPDLGLSTLVADPASAPASGIYNVIITLTALNGSGMPTPGQEYLLTPSSGTVELLTDTAITDDDGVAIWEAKSSTEQTGVTFSAEHVGTAVTVGPSNAVEFTNPEEGSTWAFDPSPITDGTCMSCAGWSFAPNLVWFAPQYWAESTPHGWACDAGVSGLYWYLSILGVDATLAIYEIDTAAHLVVYHADATGWTLGDPLTFNHLSDDGRCVWPATINATCTV